ncbi:Cys-Cys-COOH (seleno)protein SaoC [Cetobacterium sp. SF1]|uniref:Cys-Cys-COOH (seleno)protein SaoC n=1 Tax=Cetobacterium sp. SF1 TaxID=3417654 RepID=UPI003CFB2BA6
MVQGVKEVDDKIKKILKLIIPLIIFLGGFYGYKANENHSSKEEIIHNEITENYTKEFKEKILLFKENDLDGDGNLETVFIVQKKDKCFFRIAYLDNGKILYTEELPAPVERQEIIFNDYDQDGITEIIISGYKEDKIGYGVYKFQNGEIKNIFEESMSQCC